jgi:F-type H+-transporting ATPase subunit epsilon
VNAPGEEGDFGVLPHHIALLATLRPGTLTVAGIEGGVGEARKSWKIGLGFAEAGPDRVTILTESCEELLPQG